MELNTIHNCDAMTLLKALPDSSVDCCVTSPPYFGLRDYSVAGQIGLEATPALYVQTLVTLFRELRRVLKDSGTFWLNLGDSYNGSGKGGQLGEASQKQATNKGANLDRPTRLEGLENKQLMLMPHRVAIALQDDGWICRQDNVWAKPNPMPESVTDRTTRAHEYVFQFAKCGRYYYNIDAIKEPVAASTVGRGPVDFGGAKGRAYEPQKGDPNFRNGKEQWGRTFDYTESCVNGRNKRSVWTMPPGHFSGAHFATFPNEIPEICIKAGCPPGGLVLDPFMGSGTTALVARAEGRNFIGSELNADYVKIANDRLAVPYTPMFAEMLI